MSSCSPSRASLLTGLPAHQNGMYGLHQGYHNFQSFESVKTLPNLLRNNEIRTGIIGKKHVGPKSIYSFDFEETEENNSIMQVGRNITLIKDLVRSFLSTNDSNPFLLYVAFHDPHRCGHTHPEYGQFCEKFGTGEPGMGTIPDWRPDHYEPDEIDIPYFVQDTPAARADLAAYCTTISRLDQGVGLVLEELEQAGHLNDTLIVFSSDNGAPYPNGRTNVYEPGLKIPLIISSPTNEEHWNTDTEHLTSLLDITPTILDWFNVSYPDYKLFHNYSPVRLTGRSLLNAVSSNSTFKHMLLHASHSLHEITMYYPMRSIRTRRFKLIHNLSYRMPFPIDQDFYISSVFQDILNRTMTGEELPWYKTLEQYYYRPQWELFDLQVDFTEKNNMAGNVRYKIVLSRLQRYLHHWQNVTQDPWMCSPGGVLQDSGRYAQHHRCMPLFTGL